MIQVGCRQLEATTSFTLLPLAKCGLLSFNRVPIGPRWPGEARGDARAVKRATNGCVENFFVADLVRESTVPATGSGIVEAIILGVVQGIAEFLPISSSGHIVIVNQLLADTTGGGMGEHTLAMNVALHVGSLFSIIAVYWRDLLGVLKSPRIMALIVLASIPVAIVGFTLDDVLKQAFSEPLYAAFALLGTAAILWTGQRLEKGTETIETLSVGRTSVIGLLQAFAIIPGISRSGTTIAAGLLTGLKREAAARFSFFIAIPPIAGAGLKTLLEIKDEGPGDLPVTAVLIGMATSFVVGYFALRWLISLVSRGRLHVFAWYCVVVGLATIAWRLTVL